jgi:hypothetical protein
MQILVTGTAGFIGFSLARAHWHLIGAGRLPDDSSILGAGGYEDEYVRTPEGWRIKLMRVIWGRGAALPGGWTETDPNLM